VPVSKNYLLFIALFVFTGVFQGCVERILTIHSEPSGAVVWLNGEEAGVTPIETTFTWYGTYEVVVRKEGYQPVRTSQQLPAPVYQWPVFDLVAEYLLPITFVDDPNWVFALEPIEDVDPNGLQQRAEKLQGQLEQGR
jgi:hypothetical protein